MAWGAARLSAGTCTLGPSQAHGSACWLAGVPASLVLSIRLSASPSVSPRCPLLLRHCPSAEPGVCRHQSLPGRCTGGHSAGHHSSPLSDRHVLHRDSGHCAPRPAALSTGASHLIAVVLFYGTTGVIHPRPRASCSPESKQVVSRSSTLVTSFPHLQPSEQGGEGCPGASVLSYQGSGFQE